MKEGHMPDRKPNEAKPWEPRLEKEPVFNPFASPVSRELEPEETPQVDEEPAIEKDELSLDAGETARERVTNEPPTTPLRPAER
jgi:hypothetical protein